MRKSFLLVGLFLLGALFIVPEATSQRLYLSGGALASQDKVTTSEFNGTNPVIRGGAAYDVSDHVRGRTGITFQQNNITAEALAQFNILDAGSTVVPFLYTGYGRNLRNSQDKGTFPIGIGVEYRATPNLGITAEVDGRWTLNRQTFETRRSARRNGGVIRDELIASVMPTIGITYKFNRIERRPPGETPVEGDDESEIANQDFGGQEQFQGQNTGESVSTPFRDPTELASQGGPPKFELSVSRDSLKRAEPLIIEKGEPTPFDDPGVPPISGEVSVSDNGDMVRLPDGTFIMGLTDEDPFDIQNAGRKRVTVSSFYMDRFEVTNSEYREYLDDINDSQREQRLPDSTAFRQAASRADWSTYFYGSTYDDYPVVAVTWQSARDYCEWDGKRLPTEAEWEYAARAGRVGGIYPWAGFSPQDSFGRFLANYNPGRQGQAADGYAFTAPVGSYPPSRWGLHDMAGNVAEWVFDAYAPTYSNLSDLDPVYTDEEETRHVVRGGSWSSNAFRIGVGFRDYQEAEEASPRIGFRCAADISQIEGTSRRPGPPQQQGQQGPPQPGQQGPPQQGQQGPPQQGQQPPQGGQQPPEGGQQGPPPQGGQQQGGQQQGGGQQGGGQDQPPEGGGQPSPQQDDGGGQL